MLNASHLKLYSEAGAIIIPMSHKLYYSTVQRRDIRAKVQKQLVKGLQTAWVRDRALNFGFCLLVKCYFRVLPLPA